MPFVFFFLLADADSEVRQAALFDPSGECTRICFRYVPPIAYI